MNNYIKLILKNLPYAAFVCGLILFSTIARGQVFKLSPCENSDISDSVVIDRTEIQKIMDEIVHLGVPGAIAAIYDKNGLYTFSSGFACIEDSTPMETCYLQYLQSISKTYMAVAIMKLYEAGKINLAAPITDYLPEKVKKNIVDGDKIKVNMLLNHTSGLPEYNYAPVYITRLLQNPERIFQPAEYIEYIRGKCLDFEPGSSYSYRNTNYVLLAMIADQLTGDHGKYLEDKIFRPLGLTHTFYRIEQGNTYDNKLVNSYWDRYGNGILENVSVLQNTNVASMVGDDGIITTPEEAILFLKGLLEGKIVSKSTLQMMQNWAMGDDDKPEYGLGLDYAIFNDLPSIGHSGGGLGSGCQLYYVPSKNIYFFLGINLGTVTESPISEKVAPLVENLHKAILK
jgi:D-alanyl-D-alanine carboxypeptidase